MAYVTKTDYLLFDGINLEIELPDDDNALGKVERFIDEVERFTIMELRKYGFTESMINSGNIKDFKYGIMYQIRHFLKNGRDGKLSEDTWNYLHSVGIINPLRF